MNEKHLPPLDLTGPASQVAERWRKWKRAFEYYAEGKGIENVRKKTSQLLHFAGMEVQDIFSPWRKVLPLTKLLLVSWTSIFESRRTFLTNAMFFVR